MDKLERLLNLTAALLDAVRPLTAQEIKSRVPGYPDSETAFRRQFERDKEGLRALGIPLRTEPIPYSDPPADGYRIRKQEYEMRDPELLEDELSALHLAVSLVRLAGVAGADAFWRLGGEPSHGSTDARASGTLPSPEALPIIFDAISQRRPVELRYRNRERVLEPIALHFERGHWYLRAHDRGHGEFRSFRIDRIEGTPEIRDGERFAERPETVSLVPEPWEIGEEVPVRARVLVDAHLASWATQGLGSETIEEVFDDGSVVLALDVTNRAAFHSFVLGFLEHAEILEPAEYRESFVQWLDDFASGVSTVEGELVGESAIE